jgi:hypothetical protein
LNPRCVILLICLLLGGGVRAADPVGDLGIAGVRAPNVELRHDADGWTLISDGKPLYVKGVNWSYTPVGQKYDFDRWSLPHDTLKRLVDEDASVMKSMGVNAVRLLGDVPPEWITYLYHRYGIYTILNHFAGRYGATVNGAWRYPTDYSDPATRAAILADTAAYVRRYKDVPGVLCFAYGNEGNYGLEWTSAEIENLPTGERQAAKAKHLYSLLEAVVAQSKSIDPHHPALFVNGDLQYLDLIAATCPSIDLLGVNAYRGKDFGDLWRRAAAALHKPVLLIEFGCDAFNAKAGREDEADQAEWLTAQLQDMRANSHGHGGAGVCLGGTIFEFADEWWKFGQQSQLDVHNTEATWSCPPYSFDYAPGRNNMNEEWWGLCAIEKDPADGLNPRRPRKACDAVRAVWGGPD